MSDKPKIVTNCTPLYIAGGVATIIAAFAHPEDLAIKLDHEHPDPPNAPTSPANSLRMTVQTSGTSTASLAPIFYYPGSG